MQYRGFGRRICRSGGDREDPRREGKLRVRKEASLTVAHAASRKNVVTLTFTYCSMALSSYIATLASCDDGKKKKDPNDSESYNGFPNGHGVLK